MANKPSSLYSPGGACACACTHIHCRSLPSCSERENERVNGGGGRGRKNWRVKREIMREGYRRRRRGMMKEKI
jgi:hypothetical protein